MQSEIKLSSHQKYILMNDGRLKKAAILREIDGTLNRLDTDYLDIYIIHRFDYETNIEETMEALNEVVKAGKVMALGASAMYAYQFYNMQMVAKDNNFARFEVMQNHYNLIYREDEREMIPICKQMNVSLMPYSPLAGGRLSRANWNSDSIRSSTDKVSKNKYDSTMEQDMQIVKRVEEIAKSKNATMSQIAIAWLLEKGAVSPIVGATKAKYLDDAVGAFNINLSFSDLAYLEELYIPHKIVGAIDKNPPQNEIPLSK